MMTSSYPNASIGKGGGLPEPISENHGQRVSLNHCNGIPCSGYSESRDHGTGCQCQTPSIGSDTLEHKADKVNSVGHRRRDPDG